MRKPPELQLRMTSFLDLKMDIAQRLAHASITILMSLYINTLHPLHTSRSDVARFSLFDVAVSAGR